MNQISRQAGIERYSQCGEDGVLIWLFNGKQKGFYVDVGCHDPFRYSNTAILHLHYGWSGINIDVDEQAIARFNESRPNDINICVGIAREPGMLEATFFEEGAVNSLDPVTASNPAWQYSLIGKRMVTVLRLEDVLEKYLPLNMQIDFLNIDAEGLDHDVLLSNNWDKYRPHSIAVEIHGFDLGCPSNNSTYNLLTGLGYKLISHVVSTSIFTSVQGIRA